MSIRSAIQYHSVASTNPHEYSTFRYPPVNLRILVKQADWCYKFVDIDSIFEKINMLYYIMNFNFVYIIDSKL